MKDGFVRVAAMTPALRVADVDYNVDACADAVRAAKAQVVVLPELAITSYTCEDLFLQEVLLDAAEKGVARLWACPCAWQRSSTTVPRCCAMASFWALCPSGISPCTVSSTKAAASVAALLR